MIPLFFCGALPPIILQSYYPTILDIKSEVHHIAVLHNVFLPFNSQLTGLLYGSL